MRGPHVPACNPRPQLRECSRRRSRSAIPKARPQWSRCRSWSGSRTGSMRSHADYTDLACAKAPSRRKYRRSRLPLQRPVLRGTTVEATVALIGQIRGQCVVLDRISGERTKGRLLPWLTPSHPLDLHDQGLIQWHIEWLIGDNGPAVKLTVMKAPCRATSSSMPGTPEVVHFT